MSTKETKKVKVTIDDGGEFFGLRKYEVEILHHRHDLDGSELIIMRTDQRESVQKFMHDELIEERGEE